MIQVQSSEFADAQFSDSKLGPLIKFIQNHELPSDKAIASQITETAKQFKIKNGILIREQGNRIVVPKNLIHTVIRNYHDNTLSAHQGIRETLATISVSYWWSGMSKK